MEHDMSKQAIPEKTVDYAIVGGGVSGLYAGWRLLQHTKTEKKTVALFERSTRIGGRLLTWYPLDGPQKDLLRAELGGMRFLEHQRLVWTLTQHLGLEKTDFPVQSPNLRLFLRGTSTTMERPQPVRDRYKLKEQEKKTPDQLLSAFIDKILADNREIIQQKIGKDKPQTRQEWDKVKHFLLYKKQGQEGETALWKVGFWNILSDYLSAEAYQYLGDSFGYYSLVTNWNAAEAIQNIVLDHEAGNNYKTLKKGYAALTDTLGQQLKKAGAALCLNQTLISIDREDMSKPYTLTFERTTSPHEQVKVHAEKIILALPAWSLKQIQPTQTFNPRAALLKPWLDTVVSIPAFKLFLFYEERWWEKACIDIKQGRSICDLPLRQTYYFAPDQTDTSAVKEGLLMASYDDARVVDYWRGMEKRPPLLTTLSQEIRGKAEYALSQEIDAFKGQVAAAIGADEQLGTVLVHNVQGRTEALKTMLREDMDSLFAQLAEERAQAQEAETLMHNALDHGIAMNFSGLATELLEEEEAEPQPVEIGTGTQAAVGLLSHIRRARSVSQQQDYAPPPQLHDATPQMCQRAKEQLALLHGVQEHDIPDPKYAACADWSMEPFGGGWHFWEPGLDVEQIMKNIKQPLSQQPIYIVGEAYSGVQGWVEGALTTTEKVLQDKLQLQPPDWLDKNYYLGW
jgi:monoamine oxidase